MQSNEYQTNLFVSELLFIKHRHIFAIKVNAIENTLLTVFGAPEIFDTYTSLGG